MMLFTTILKQTIDLAIAARPGFAKPDNVNRTKGKRRLVRVLASEIECQPPSEADNKLIEFLRNQRAATVYMLAAVMYLGRGDFDDDFDPLDRYTQMAETFAKVEYAVQQIAFKVPLPHYLQDGFDILTKAGIEIDEFMRSRKGENGESVLL
jgi:Protein of unknown function (DUF3775)